MERRRTWFRAIVPGGHVGAGHVREQTVFVYAASVSQANSILLARTHGWKKSRGVLSLEQMSEGDVIELEALIQARGDPSLSAVKHSGFYYSLRLHSSP